MESFNSTETAVLSSVITEDKIVMTEWSHKCLKCGLVVKDTKSYGSLCQWCSSGGFHSWCNTKVE